MSDRKVIKFKYLRNCTISLGDGPVHSIPAKTVPVRTSIRENDKDRLDRLSKEYPEVAALRERLPKMAPGTAEYRIAITSEFDMDKVFEIEMLDETPYLPKKEPGMSLAYWNSLCDEVYEKVRENRKRNNLIRARLEGYAKPSTSELLNGVKVEIPPAIQILEDPFSRETVADSPEIDAMRKGEAAVGAPPEKSKKHRDAEP